MKLPKVKPSLSSNDLHQFIHISQRLFSAMLRLNMVQDEEKALFGLALMIAGIKIYEEGLTGLQITQKEMHKK